MTRIELVRQMALLNPDLGLADAMRIVDAIFAAIADHLAKNGRVELRGFGAFSTRLRPARAGVNPRTGAPVDVSTKRLVYFRPGKQMHEAINADAGTTKAAGRSRPPSQIIRT